LHADNMFRSWQVSCKKFLKAKGNHLVIHFYSAVKQGKKLAAKIPYQLPGEEKVFTRKAAYQYGWDWGPSFPTCGIWKNVQLIAYDDLRLQSARVTQKNMNDSLATIEISIELYGAQKKNVQLFLDDGAGFRK